MTDFAKEMIRHEGKAEEINMEPAWLLIAKKELGIHETPGPAATARIVEYDKATTLKATSDEVPWCAAFVCWCLEQAGIESTHSAAAASYLNWGKDIGDTPEEGCIVVFPHHVTFYVDGVDDDYIKCLGGNQADSVKYSNFPVANVLSYRMPA